MPMQEPPVQGLHICQFSTPNFYNLSHGTVKFSVYTYSIVMLVQFYTCFRLETSAVRKWPTKLVRYLGTPGASETRKFV